MRQEAGKEGIRRQLSAMERRWSGHIPQMLGGRCCAVLCPLVEMPEGLSFLFEIRAAALRQGGETCFPGGQMEPGESAAACALRETCEELAIPPETVRILGQGDFLCHHRGLVVYPVVGAVSPRGMAALHPAASETAEVFTVPLSFFQSTPPEVYAYDLTARAADGFPYEALGIPPDYSFGKGQVEVPLWQYRGRVVWGMTARIVRSLLDL